ncbi:MAG: hypothetical protein ACHQUB_01675 [Candidatus Saccharimonadia bacterium]
MFLGNKTTNNYQIFSSENLAPLPTTGMVRSASKSSVTVQPILPTKAVSQKIMTNSNTNAPTRYIGVFISTSPSDPNFQTALDEYQQLGVNIVYNYSAFDGTIAQVNAFLDYANSKKIKVIVNLAQLYDNLAGSSANLSDFAQYGSSNEAIALSVVKNFQSNPGVWGFSIADETPETSNDLSVWQPILADRYAKVKELTAKPIMAVMVGWNDSNQNNRIELFSSVKKVSDTLALDYYPVPYLPTNNISTFLRDAGPNNWFVEQAFSWASYPDTASMLGFDPNIARFPTYDEMLQMAQMGISSATQNILFFSYFDIANNPAQVQALSHVIHALR